MGQSTQHHRFRFSSAVVSDSALMRRYGLGSLAHRAGVAVASSVTMYHDCKSFLGCRVAHRHLYVLEVMWVWSVAKAGYSHCQDASNSHPVTSQRWLPERCGAGCGSRLACASWLTLQFYRYWRSLATAKLHNAPLLKVLVQSVAGSLGGPAPLTRPLGLSSRRYAKLPALMRSPAACTPRSLRALRAVVCCPGGGAGAAAYVRP